MMKQHLFGIFFLLLAITTVQASWSQAGFSRTDYFKAMASENSALIDAQLRILKNISGSDKDAFEGAMLMRKAAKLSVPAKKLAAFKQGHKKLENAIGKDPDNAEYRFLRIMVQENAPRALGYNKNIEVDSKIIKENYKRLAPDTQQGIAAYAKTSKALAGAF